MSALPLEARPANAPQRMPWFLAEPPPRRSWSLPQPHDDELGYGTVARLVQDWGGHDLRALLSTHIGFRIHGIHTAAPPGLCTVAARMLPHSHDPVTQLINQHTLLPYLLSFAQPRYVERAQTALHAHARTSVARLLAKPCFMHAQPPFLQLCGACANEDVERVDEAYWHRRHQLPGVAHCPVHGERLLQSGVSAGLDRTINPHTPRSAMRSTPASHLFSRGLGRPCTPVFRPAFEAQVARASLRLLQDGLTNAHHQSRTLSYRALVYSLGYAARGTEIQANRFAQEFCRWTDQQCLVPGSMTQTAWWKCLISDTKGQATPLQHLLMRAFIRERLLEQGRNQDDLFGFDIDSPPTLAPARQWKARSGHT